MLQPPDRCLRGQSLPELRMCLCKHRAGQPQSSLGTHCDQAAHQTMQALCNPCLIKLHDKDDMQQHTFLGMKHGCERGFLCPSAASASTSCRCWHLLNVASRSSRLQGTCSYASPSQCGLRPLVLRRWGLVGMKNDRVQTFAHSWTSRAMEAKTIGCQD